MSKKRKYYPWGPKAKEWVKRRIAFHEELIRTAKSKPCADCTNIFPHYVMDFDHVRGEKKFTLGAHGGALLIKTQRILDEIAKCDVVCANCHRIRTWNRNWQFARGTKSGFYSDKAEPTGSHLGEEVPNVQSNAIH